MPALLEEMADRKKFALSDSGLAKSKVNPELNILFRALQGIYISVCTLLHCSALPRLVEVGRFENPKIQEHYQPGQV